MTSRSLPSALESYVRLPPEASLILLTSTLACSVNWLTTRFISGALIQDENSPEEQVSILLVSWMRDLAFWKTDIRRGTALDISKLSQANQFAFTDCFSDPSITISDSEKRITEALSKLSQAADRRILLVLDNPDVLLATASATTLELNHLLLRLRVQVYSTIVTCSADQPLVSSATVESRSTPIEAETAAFVTTQAHAARLVLSVRELDTGAAKDISGVLRITRGGEIYDLDEDERDTKEAELLYLIQRDGNAKVFSRGSGHS
ncbi:hypothetical protein AC579_8503 [Pseudocercospora musae]|uniref:Elongator complex protein 5 n=1 Tax=Pseudocercospora musae TaxID=113226 RepID=A0A139IFU8_9PEZI|nr:hypothetical protein AC579_8503 [Pseudocercospora musae]KXT13588.1 hypothetical protein AC579_8503 [Pseudocercospora musae]